MAELVRTTPSALVSVDRLRAVMQQQAAVAELGQIALRAPLQEVFQRAITAVRGTLKADLASIAELTPDMRSMHLRAAEGWGGENSAPLPFMPRSITGRAVSIREPVLVQDYHSQDEFDPPPRIRHPHDIRSGLSVPIRLDEDHIWGALALFCIEPRAYTDDDVHFVEAVANVVGGAIERIRARDALAESETRYRAIVEAATEGIGVIDPSGRFTYVNERHCQLLGYTQHEMLAMSCFDIMQPEEREAVRKRGLRGFKSVLRREACFVRKDGSPVWCMLSSTPLMNGKERVGALTIVTDITERKLAEQTLAHQALHDALTELPNRVLMHDRLEQALRASARSQSSGAVAMIDLDRFKDVNDTYGHDAGDAVLRKVAQRLHSSLRVSDTVARWGGDEFAVLLPGCSTAHTACAVASKILEGIREPLEIDGHEVRLEASIGVALFPSHAGELDDLVRCADTAMYRAKRAGGGVSLFGEELPVSG
ncbi:MAG: sensor domain-containing diguanylate cyclase [Chloroflexi bacterium]|nr:sensor domain-containing diguanylate cyclase [Chloroflexota bacterium]